MFSEGWLLLLAHGPFLLLFVALVVTYWVSSCPCTKNSQKCNPTSASQMIIDATKDMFSFLNQESTKREIVLFGFEVPDHFILNLFWFAVFVILFALALFWKEYILEDVPCVKASNSIFFCCYAFACNFNNCSHYLNDETDFNTEDDNSLNCYKLSFPFGNAFSTSAGFFASFIFITTLMTFVLLGVSGGSNGSRKRWCFTILLQVLYISFVFAFSGIHFTAFVLSVLAHLSYNQRISYFLACFASFCLAYYVILTIPWWKFKKIQEGHSHEDVERQATEHTRLIQAT